MNIVTTENNLINDRKDVKIIRKTQLARQILRKGQDRVRVVDIKPDKTDPDHKRSVLAFENSEDFQRIFAEVLEDNKKSREQHYSDENAELRREIEEMKRRFEELTKATESVNNTEAG